MFRFKSVLIPIFICAFLIFGTTSLVGQSCATVCSYGGCTTVLGQNSDGWEMAINCGGSETTYSGSGDYSVTICGGVEPCNVPMVN